MVAVLASVAWSPSIASAADPPKAAAQPAAGRTELLDVVINGNRIGQIGQFLDRGGALFARREELRSLGFKIPDTVPLTPDGRVALSSLSGLAARVDEPTQALYVTTIDKWLTPTMLGAQPNPANSAVESGAGVTLNYDVTATMVDGRTSATGLFDGRFFSRLGVLSSGFLVHAGPGTTNSGQGLIRLDTTWVYSDPGTMRRYRLGDFIGGSLAWTRPVRMTGFQVNSDFSMRPDLITFPVPSVAGSAAVPSTVDVLVNGMHTVSGSVPPGPFEVPQVPVISGAGTIETTVTDALGRQVVTNLAFYASPELLAPGLQTYSGEIGFVRRDWGLVSNDYGNLAAAATYRRGLSPTFTIEGHAEHTASLSMGGIGGVLNLWNVAVANVAIAASSDATRAGREITAGIQRQTRHYTIGGSVTVASHDFQDIAAVNGDPISTFQLNANAGLSLKGLGSLGIAYNEVRRLGAAESDEPGPPIVSPGGIVPIQGPLHLKLLSLSYSRQIGKLALYATALHDFGDQKATGISVGLTVPLDVRTSANASVQSASGTRSGQIEISRNATEPGQWGFRFLASAQGGATSEAPFVRALADHEFGQVTDKAQWGQLFAGIDRSAGLTTVQAEARGAVSFVDAALFASNWIDDSFAIVDTNGVAGIRVRQENRDVGRTGSDGRLLVADLRSFEPNHLSIDPLDAPVDAEVPVADLYVRPQDDSGVVVHFPLKISHGALLRLVDPAGKPLPVGSSATLKSSGVAAPVGYDGEAYVTDLQSHNEVMVAEPDGKSCIVDFESPAIAGQIPTIGPLVCREVAK